MNNKYSGNRCNAGCGFPQHSWSCMFWLTRDHEGRVSGDSRPVCPSLGYKLHSTDHSSKAMKCHSFLHTCGICEWRLQNSIPEFLVINIYLPFSLLFIHLHIFRSINYNILITFVTISIVCIKHFQVEVQVQVKQQIRVLFNLVTYIQLFDLGNSLIFPMENSLKPRQKLQLCFSTPYALIEPLLNQPCFL